MCLRTRTSTVVRSSKCMAIVWPLLLNRSGLIRLPSRSYRRPVLLCWPAVCRENGAFVDFRPPTNEPIHRRLLPDSTDNLSKRRKSPPGSPRRYQNRDIRLRSSCLGSGRRDSTATGLSRHSRRATAMQLDTAIHGKKGRISINRISNRWGYGEKGTCYWGEDVG